MVKQLKNFSKSIMAGMSIVIGATAYVSLGGFTGALIFSIGLYLVLWYGLDLYTGKVGYATEMRDVGKLLLIFIGNTIGCALAFLIPPGPVVAGIAAAKLSTHLIIVFFKAVICGILIYAGVDQYRKQKEYAPLVAVPAFILAGAEHCIADICYFIMARCFTLEALIFIFIVAIGNAIGSILWRRLTT